MKNVAILMIIGVLITTGCFAQNKYQEGISKLRGQRFQILYPGLNNDYIVVYNVKNKFALGGPRSDNPNALAYRKEDIHFDAVAARETVKKVLNPKSAKLRQNDDNILVQFVFEQSGRLSDITYGLNINTVVTLEDIAEIDDQLRRTLRAATFSGKAFHDHKFFRYSLGMIRFE